MEENLICLRELSIFQGLNKSEFNTICPGVINKMVAKGQFLFYQGEKVQTIYLVKAGKLKLFKNTEDGREVIINIIGPGQVLGETTLFQDEEVHYSAVAIENTRFCCFSRPDFELIIKRNPSFAVSIISFLVNKLNTTLQHVTESTGASVKEKLLKLLIRFANEHGSITSEVTVIKLNITQEEIGNMIGASRVQVAQVFRELKMAGIVNRQGKFYTIRTDFCTRSAGV